MKKNQVSMYPRLWLLVLCASFLLSGCFASATNIAYIPSVPPEKTCTINIATTFIINKFDGQPVSWRPNFGDSWAQVTIPEGSHTFVFDYNYSDYHASGLVVTYDHFKAGHTYLMTAQFFPAGTNSISIRAGVKDVTNEPDWSSLSKAFNWTEGFEWLPLTREK